MMRLRYLCGLAALLATLAMVTVGLAQDEAEYPSIVASADGITLPDALVSGITTLTLQNDSELDFQPAIGRFIDGNTMEDFTAAMMAQDFAGMLATVSVLGAPTVAPGEAVDVTYDLIAGDYLLLHFNPAGPPTLLPFTVAENEGEAVEAPEADVEVVMVDFAFGMPIELTTGESIWHFSNEGENLHEIVIVAVDDNATTESVTKAYTEAMMAAAAAGPGTPMEAPFEQVSAFVGISPGENAWMTVDLPPGTYAAVCLVPDFSTTPPSTHLHHGMVVLLTVGE